ncbi:MAG TPA: Fic family protein [Nannocystis exedens]|nr:Fic family protein [Nannocystis exedens]
MQAYIPCPLPPNPPLVPTSTDYDLMERANRALGRLDGISALLPNVDLFIYTYVRKEAVLSSQIEGTQSSLSDLLLHENSAAPGLPTKDVDELINYVAAMNHGLSRIAKGFPLSLRLLREIHCVLMQGMRGKDKNPGEFRRVQNWLGAGQPRDAVFVPPPPQHLMACLDPFERFLHGQPEPTPLLIKAALAHVQFETIHPFLDGNGRLGRLLITLLLCAEKALSQPLLYLSLFFKKNRSEYYERLQNVRVEGAWEAWLRFFLRGVLETAESGVQSATRLLQASNEHEALLTTLGRRALSAIQVLKAMKRRPVATVGSLANDTGLSPPTVASSLARMTELNLIREVTGRQRDRVFAYWPYLDILSEGTEPLR